MNRTHEFIELYNCIDEYLCEFTDREQGINFQVVLNEAAEKNTVVRQHKARLKQYSRFRNTIVHDRHYLTDPIAEPTEATLESFRSIVSDITRPKRLIPTFRRSIRCFSTDEPLLAIISYMSANDFSQAVVRENGYLTLLTVEGVARWLGAQAPAEIISVVEPTVSDALKLEISEAFIVLPHSKTVGDAREAFARSIEQKRPRLFAILVTHSGKRTEEPLGIVTPWDLLS